MSERYEHLPIERKWQKIWDDTHCFEAKDDFTKPKYYALIEFPFPSGAGLHVGHPRSNTALDIISRKRQATMSFSRSVMTASVCRRRIMQ